ncbi:MAG: CoA transferase subunit B [Chloroflexi bacterium]|nr:CoA transferase subunit B [Chloroflexota bacterium]MBI3931187.1 CoA transferase subunit B [Chloroflexota bacterium]
MKSGLSRELIAMRAAKELKDGDYVNLGIGLPTQVSSFIPEDVEVIFHSENGILGFGRIADENERDPDLINAGAQPITLKPGAAFFNSADAFAMIRGGYIDVAVLGAFQVSEKGDLANWMILEKKVGNIGGSMDLVVAVKEVIITMEHTTRKGAPRIVKECTYPLTGRGVVNLIITNLAVIAVTPEGLLLKEVAPSVTPQEVQSVTEPKLRLAADLHEMEL